MSRQPEPSLIVVTPNGNTLTHPTTHVSVCDAIRRLAPLVPSGSSWRHSEETP